ncbi:hypothetical protein EVG20_g4103 [Dentipellis fragilis]|uniref:Uncharacterized protein n=1 Tax=Dentipellis fragilis TaxID=205917 RepID=A0A4Y9Z0R6_9AGAM|nr:hypothetical protein EVG20_g4103 [Dentipellis fragilis]
MLVPSVLYATVSFSSRGLARLPMLLIRSFVLSAPPCHTYKLHATQYYLTIVLNPSCPTTRYRSLVSAYMQLTTDALPRLEKERPNIRATTVSTPLSSAKTRFDAQPEVGCRDDTRAREGAIVRLSTGGTYGDRCVLLPLATRTVANGRYIRHTPFPAPLSLHTHQFTDRCWLELHPGYLIRQPDACDCLRMRRLYARFHRASSLPRPFVFCGRLVRAAPAYLASRCSVRAAAHPLRRLSCRQNVVYLRAPMAFFGPRAHSQNHAHGLSLQVFNSWEPGARSTFCLCAPSVLLSTYMRTPCAPHLLTPSAPPLCPASTLHAPRRRDKVNGGMRSGTVAVLPHLLISAPRFVLCASFFALCASFFVQQGWGVTWPLQEVQISARESSKIYEFCSVASGLLVEQGKFTVSADRECEAAHPSSLSDAF